MLGRSNSKKQSFVPKDSRKQFIVHVWHFPHDFGKTYMKGEGEWVCLLFSDFSY